MLSLPVWECGLKSRSSSEVTVFFPSLPVWECGLKYETELGAFKIELVTPCMGVWIEIDEGLNSLILQTGHSLYGSVD